MQLGGRALAQHALALGSICSSKNKRIKQNFKSKTLQIP
jgi:hypothetical protein